MATERKLTLSPEEQEKLAAGAQALRLVAEYTVDTFKAAGTVVRESYQRKRPTDAYRTARAEFPHLQQKREQIEQLLEGNNSLTAKATRYIIGGVHLTEQAPVIKQGMQIADAITPPLITFASFVNDKWKQAQTEYQRNQERQQQRGRPQPARQQEQPASAPRPEASSRPNRMHQVEVQASRGRQPVTMRMELLTSEIEAFIGQGLVGASQRGDGTVILTGNDIAADVLHCYQQVRTAVGSQFDSINQTFQIPVRSMANEVQQMTYTTVDLLNMEAAGQVYNAQTMRFEQRYTEPTPPSAQAPKPFRTPRI